MMFVAIDLFLLAALFGALHWFGRQVKRKDAERIDDRFSYEAWHTGGAAACGKLAFMFVDDPRLHGMTSSRAYLLSHQHHEPRTVPICGSCGKQLVFLSLLELRRIDKIYPKE